MNLETQIFCVVFVIFMWMLSAWEALIQLSGGRVRRVEEKDRQLSRKLEEWIEDRKEYDIVFRAVILLFISAMATLGYLIFSSKIKTFSPISGAMIISLGIFGLIVAAETVARLLLYKFDIIILRYTLPVIRFLGNTLMFPAIFLLEEIENMIDRRQQLKSEEDKTSAEDEIMSLVEKVDRVSDIESIEEEEKKMIKGVFDLDDVLVREVMTPRIDIVALRKDATQKEAKEKFISSGYSRIPVYEDSLDEIRGILYAKDFLDVHKTGAKSILELSHKPIFIPESKTLRMLLTEFKKTGKHFAVIIDEYGGTAGILTLEDIIESVVGEIRDEYDTEEDVPAEPVFMPDGSMRIEGRTLITTVNELFKTDISEDEDLSTIGGYVCSNIGKIPEPGEEFILHGNTMHVKIIQADKRKIISLNISMIKPAEKK